MTNPEKRAKERQKKCDELYAALSSIDKNKLKRYVFGINEKRRFYAKIYLSNGEIIKL